LNNFNNLTLFKRVWNHLTKLRKKQLLFLSIIMVITAFAEVISISSIIPFLGILTSPEIILKNKYAQPILSLFGISNIAQLLPFVTLFFIIAIIFSNGMKFILLWYKTRIGYAIGSDFSVAIYLRTLYQPYNVHISRNSSEIVSTITLKARALVNGTIIPIMTILSSILIIISILITLLMIQPIVAISTFLSFGLVYFLIAAYTKKRLKLYSENISKSQVNVQKALTEGLGGIRDILINGTQQFYIDLYKNSDLTLRKSQSNIEIISGTPRYLLEGLGMILIALLAFSFTKNTNDLSRTIPVLGSMALGSQQLLPILQQAFSSLTAFRGNKASLIDSLNLLDQSYSSANISDRKNIIPFNDKICLININFKYDNSKLYILKNINLEIPRGSTVGFIGSTGSGKSTLLDVIMGLLKPSNGLIKIDNININEINNQNWQLNLSHVPQTIYLSDASIAENIAIGVTRNEIDYNLVEICAIKAQLHETIAQWENKYTTRVGERGIMLSGGQRQRIGIARALYKKSKVLIFDEATSALDNTTESDVMDAIHSLDKDLTILIVAHRLTTLSKCNMIVHLENGSIKEVGSYNKLILKK
jgi:ABC-type multidrug transport system fused ATPase/permease subunit